jgi:MFS family permease
VAPTDSQSTPARPDGPQLSAADRARITYRYDRLRSISNGVIETAPTVFLLLVAVQWFHAGATAKAFVAGGGSLGLLLTPLVVAVVQHRQWPATDAAAKLAAGGCACFIVMAAVPHVAVFVIGSVLSMAGTAAAIPLLTQTYHDNYPEHRRGHFFSRAVMIRIAVAAGFSELGGRLLTGHLDRYRLLLCGFAAAFAFSAFCLRRFPSRPLPVPDQPHPLRALRYVATDPLFRRTLICWMLLGFGNLMMLPLRVEYLANPRYGVALAAAPVAFLTGVLPNLARLVVSPLWGWLFDRMNFFVLRVVLNAGFALGILAFFTSNSRTGLVLGSLIHGLSSAGGDVAWGLWVTKFAPPPRVADYMSVHTFFTGVRGVLAPLVAFHLLNIVSIPTLGWISGGLIALASILLLPEIPRGRGRPTAPLVEEVSE